MGQSASGGMTAQQAFAFLPPDVQAKLSTAANAYQSAAASAAPFIAFAQDVAGGGMNETQAVAGLSLVATTIGGPIAGAAMAAAGGLVLGIETGLHDLFDALGLYDHPKTYDYIGLRRRGVDVLPWGVTDPDWWTIRSINEFNDLAYGRHVSPSGVRQPALSGVQNVYAYEMLVTALHQLQTPGSSPTWPHRNLDAFELFFLPMLVKNLEMWANGSGFIPTRTLLSQAAAAWNESHASSAQTTYAPVDYGTRGYLDHSIVSMVLGGGGDLAIGMPSRFPPLTVNLGPAIAPRRNPVTLHFGSGASRAGAVRRPTTTSSPSPIGTVVVVVALGAAAWTAARLYAHKPVVPPAAKAKWRALARRVS